MYIKNFILLIINFTYQIFKLKMSEVIEILSDKSSGETSIDNGRGKKLSFVITQEPHCLQRHRLSFKTKNMYNPSALKSVIFKLMLKIFLTSRMKSFLISKEYRFISVFNFQNAASKVSLCCS